MELNSIHCIVYNIFFFFYIILGTITNHENIKDTIVSLQLDTNNEAGNNVYDFYEHYHNDFI